MTKSPKLKRTPRVKQIASRIQDWDGASAADDQPEDFEDMIQRLMNQEEHVKWLNSKASLVYGTIQNTSKEMVKIGVFAIDEVKPTSGKVRAQETDYEKYYDDHQSTKQRRDDGFRQLHVCFAPILEDLGRTRAHEVNATSELVKNNRLRRQKMLINFSKSIRSRFEEAKKKEKENADAEALIEMVKGILYY